MIAHVVAYVNSISKARYIIHSWILLLDVTVAKLTLTKVHPLVYKNCVVSIPRLYLNEDSRRNQCICYI